MLSELYMSIMYALQSDAKWCCVLRTFSTLQVRTCALKHRLRHEMCIPFQTLDKALAARGFWTHTFTLSY